MKQTTRHEGKELCKLGKGSKKEKCQQTWKQALGCCCRKTTQELRDSHYYQECQRKSHKQPSLRTTAEERGDKTFCGISLTFKTLSNKKFLQWSRHSPSVFLRCFRTRWVHIWSSTFQLSLKQHRNLCLLGLLSTPLASDQETVPMVPLYWTNVVLCTTSFLHVKAPSLAIHAVTDVSSQAATTAQQLDALPWAFYTHCDHTESALRVKYRLLRAWQQLIKVLALTNAFLWTHYCVVGGAIPFTRVNL